ncbi:NAD(P)/FAD-dependent oxidoreductase [Aliikangiella maris]|uniref:FAD-dependent oxidoreductase n=2 Tax=Aliikangiella maris TaxID=3162458 RepID=A0ABV3MNI4_9GAMM
MKIAIVGSGIAGNTVAYHLHKEHDITLFEANDYIGGHTHTHQLNLHGEQQNVDSGFIVFNQQTYPNFLNLINELGVAYQESTMSFSVQCEKTGLVYNGSSFDQLFTQRRNFFKPSFYRMVFDILRFNKESLSILEKDNFEQTLGEYLAENRYSQSFIHQYIVPMGAAIWSTGHNTMLDFPAQFFVRFFNNHGMLQIANRPQWYVIKNGSAEYTKPLTEPFKDKIRLSCKVQNIRRQNNKVFIKARGCEEESFDYVFLACHSNQALAMLENPSPEEIRTLSAIPYTNNKAIIHYDDSILPVRKKAWAAWNYHLTKNTDCPVMITYNMNILQSLKSQHTFCVTLNPTDEIDESKILKEINYSHPLFTLDGIKAQKNQPLINGHLNTYYCGAYWRYGFHEDGVVSALNAIKKYNQDIGNEQQNLLWSPAA